MAYVIGTIVLASQYWAYWE